MTENSINLPKTYAYSQNIDTYNYLMTKEVEKSSKIRKMRRDSVLKQLKFSQNPQEIPTPTLIENSKSLA